jgi:L-ascorbate metabolism protein UlaG (beta-lactamase superfamily)
LKFEKLGFLTLLFSITLIFGFSLTITTDEALSLRELDYDRDGVLDEFDECLTVPETYNKFEDTDGCPDSVSEEKTKFQFPDTDGDGLEDRIDNCVYLPETFNDYLDYDGCPEIIPNISEGVTDSDSDTIPDSIDACPNEKETFNEFKDGDGCPDSFIPLDTAKKWEKYGIAETVVLPEEESTEETMQIETVEDSMQEQISEVKIEWLTWSFFRITTPGGVVILTNPWYTNPDSTIALEDITEADIILVPAGHPDEVGNALEIAAKTGATIAASHELINLVWKDENAGFGAPVIFDGITIQTESFQPGTTTTIDGITIRAVTALHGNWNTGGPAMGFFITMEDGYTIYFSGSTDLTLDMVLWGELFKPDTALLYLASGQNPRDVAVMAQLLSEKNPNLKTVIPLHHRLDAPEGHTPADLGNAMAELGLKAELIDPQPGVIYTLSK